MNDRIQLVISVELLENNPEGANVIKFTLSGTEIIGMENLKRPRHLKLANSFMTIIKDYIGASKS